jgi:hypothetical protein
LAGTSAVIEPSALAVGVISGNTLTHGILAKILRKTSADEK